MDPGPIIVNEWTEHVLGIFAKRVSFEIERDQSMQELNRYQNKAKIK